MDKYNKALLDYAESMEDLAYATNDRNIELTNQHIEDFNTKIDQESLIKSLKEQKDKLVKENEWLLKIITRLTDDKLTDEQLQAKYAE